LWNFLAAFSFLSFFMFCVCCQGRTSYLCGVKMWLEVNNIIKTLTLPLPCEGRTHQWNSCWKMMWSQKEIVYAKLEGWLRIANLKAISLSALLSVSLSVVYLAQNNAKTKLSLHNNRRNGVPQAAFKYKYLQLEQKNHQKAAAGQKVKSFLRFTGNFPISPCFSLSLSLSFSLSFLFFSHSLFIYLCPAHWHCCWVWLVVVGTCAKDLEPRASC